MIQYKISTQEEYGKEKTRQITVNEFEGVRIYKHKMEMLKFLNLYIDLTVVTTSKGVLKEIKIERSKRGF